MVSDYHRVLLIFVDGVGLAPAAEHNPLAQLPTPGIHGLLGGPLTLEQCRQTEDLLLAPIDANLSVDGLPQSATGQAALFTGVNAAKTLGRHITGLPGPQIRRIVESTNLFLAASQLGLTSTFANPYTQTYLDSLATGKRRPSVTTCAVSAAEIPLRYLADLRRDRAVSWDILRDRFAEQLGADLPVVTGVEAGNHLAELSTDHRLTVYETFITDMAGHDRLGFTVADALARVDGLIEGVMQGRDRSTTVVLTSDHGNLEDASHRRHTRNPVPLLVWGPLARRFEGVESILGVTPKILECFGRQDESLH